MLLVNKEVAIVGGGPGGLTLAKLLQLKGVKVKVYERDVDRNARVQGSPLDLHAESGMAALRKANLLAEFKKNYLPGADKMLITNAHADVLFSDHETKPEEDFGFAHFRPEIDRGALRQLLLESLQQENVVWDSHFLQMEKQNTGWLLHFKNGSSAYADLVIAADGANSKVRPYLTNVKACYSGVTMLEGNIYHAKQAAPKIDALLKGGKIMAFGNKKNLMLGQKGNGDMGFYASFKIAENWASTNGLNYHDRAQILAWFKKEYAEWNNIWHELFEKVDLPFIPRPIYYMPLNQTWDTLANLTLIGDAAHVMPPFAGEGANMAMLDALELSESLTSTNYGTLKEAIHSYEINMQKRAAVATQESITNGDLMHSENALANMLEMFGNH